MARLAGVPEEVTGRADEISEELSRADIVKAAKHLNADGSRAVEKPQKGIKVDITRDEYKLWKNVIGRLKKTDAAKLTPIEALLMVDELQKELSGAAE